MLRRHQPLGERQPIGGHILGERRQEGGGGRSHLLAGLAKFASMMAECAAGIISRPGLQHERLLPSLHLPLPSTNSLDRLGQFRGHEQEGGEEAFPLGLRALKRLDEEHVFNVGRDATGLGGAIFSHAETQPPQPAGEVTLKPQRDLQRLSRRQRRLQLKHRRMLPPLPAVDGPAARHIAIDRLGGGVAPFGKRLRAPTHPPLCASHGHFQLREEKIPLRAFVIGQPRPTGRQALVRQHLQPHSRHRMVRRRQRERVDVALGDIATGEHRAIGKERKMRHRGGHGGGTRHLPAHSPRRLLAVPGVEAGQQRHLPPGRSACLLRSRIVCSGGQRPLLRQLRQQRRMFRGSLGPLGIDLRSGDHPLRLVGVVHQGKQREVVGVCQRVKLMRVALRAAGGEPQPGGAGGGDAIDHRQITKLQRVDSPFLVEHRVAVKAGRHNVVGRGAGEQVAGKLANRELIKRHVGIERANHPVAVGPDRPRPVFLIAVGVGIAGQIEPAPGPAFAILRARHEPLDELLVGIGSGVGQKGVEFFGRWGDADQIEPNAAAERGPIGFRGGDEALLFQPGQHKSIDLVAGPVGPGHSRHRRRLGGDEGPMRLIFGAGGDPLFENPLLGCGEGHLRGGGRHDDIGSGTFDPSHQFAVVGMARHHCPQAAVEFPERLRPQIEPQPGLAAGFVRPMALEAAVGEDRPHLAGEVWPCGTASLASQCGQSAPQHQRSQPHATHSKPAQRSPDTSVTNLHPLSIIACQGGAPGTTIRTAECAESPF